MKNLITIGLPSKGRLKEDSISFFKKNNLQPTSNGGERNYFAQIENLPNLKIIYLHAKEIVQRLGDGTIDVGISGLDLLQESSINLIKKIEIKKKLDFGVADVVVAIPDDWIDVQTVADLEEVSFDFRDKKNTRLRVATKYPNLTNNFLVSKGVTQYKLVPSLGATETYPFIGSSEIITDITSTGKTLKSFVKKNKLNNSVFKDLSTIKNLSKINSKTIFSTNFGRDIEYYTGIVFEIYNSSKKEIARGGRYDGLLKSLGAKKNISAVGAAINLNNLQT